MLWVDQLFLPSVEPLWPVFVANMIAQLPGALPVHSWLPQLAVYPDATIWIYVEAY